MIGSASIDSSHQKQTMTTHGPLHPDRYGLWAGLHAPEAVNAVQYQRTREMTLDELLLENRVVFLVGEINHATAARVMMQMFYLEDQKRGQDINFLHQFAGRVGG
jgi:hypothetical protein